jgi:hypothetical protein
MALYSKIMFVALSPAARSQALLGPIAGFVSRMLVFANQDFSLREVQLDKRR